MTALKDFVRLEAPALWQPQPDEQRRDVVVSFGDATLIIIDRNEVALAHWSLPAIERLNPGELPAVYAPGLDAPARLEVSDADMIEAIEKIRAAVTSAQPHPGRLRRTLVIGVCVAFLAGAIFWLPSALASYAARIVPDATREAIGRDIAREMTRLAGQPCQSPAGTRALRILAGRLFPGEPVTLAVYRAGVSTAIPLPGGLILFGRDLVEDYETPEVIAGYAMAAEQALTQSEPVFDLLSFSGPLATARLMTTGEVGPDAVGRFAEHLLKTQAPPLTDDRALAEALQDSVIAIAPYPEAREITGATTVTLTASGETPEDARRPILSDTNWVALSQICGA